MFVRKILLIQITPIQIIEDMGFGQLPQDSRRSPVRGIGGKLLFFPSSQLFEIGAAAAESEFSIEPERSGLNGLVIVLADLIGIDRNASRAGEGAETAQGLGIDPCSFSLTVGVEGVEADLDPFAEADGLDVVDGDSVLEGEPGDVSAQRQTARRRQVPEMDNHSATEADADDRSRVAERGAIEFAITDSHDFADEVHNRLAVAERKPGETWHGLRKLVRE